MRQSLLAGILAVSVLVGLLIALAVSRKGVNMMKPKINPENVPRLVMAFYHGWYGSPSGPTGKWVHWNHWVMNTSSRSIVRYHNPDNLVNKERRDIGAIHYPLLGPYDVRSPEVLKTHFKWAEEAGIDVFVFDWFGPPGGYIDENMKLMLDATESFSTNIYLAVLYDGYEYRNAPPEEVSRELRYIISTYGGHSRYLKVAGHPVVFIYAAQHFPYSTWAEIISGLRKDGLDAVFLCDALGDMDHYLDVFDGIYIYTPAGILNSGGDLETIYRTMMHEAEKHKTLCALTALPGYDDTAVRIPGFQVARRNGETYRYTWEIILRLNPRWVMICSWNEWHEGTEIEPSLEHGYTYLNITKNYCNRFKGG